MSDTPITPFFDSPKNWVEDFPHDNGQYTCYCYRCGSNFIGYKRRVLCKECAIVLEENENKIQNYPSLLSELEQLRKENERLKQQAGFSEEIQKQMQVRISDEIARTFNRDHNITQLENLCRSKDMQIEKLQGENENSLAIITHFSSEITRLTEEKGKYKQALEKILNDRCMNYSDILSLAKQALTI